MKTNLPISTENPDQITKSELVVSFRQLVTYKASTLDVVVILFLF